MQYTVNSGDSLSIIARDILGDITLWPQIASMNNLTSPYAIYPGQSLQLPDTGGSVPPATQSVVPVDVTPANILTPGIDWLGMIKKYWWVGIIAIIGIPLLFKSKRRR